MESRGTAYDDSRGCGNHNSRHLGITIELCQQGSRGSESHGQQQPYAHIYPEQVTGQCMVDLVPLKHSLRKADQSYVREQQAEGGDHSHHPEIRWREEPSQDHGSDHLECKRQGLGKHRDPSTSDSHATQLAALCLGQECTICVKGLQTASLILTVA